MSKKSDERAARTAALLAQQKRDERRRRGLTIGAVVAVLAVVLGVGFFVQANRDTTGEAPSATPDGVTDGYSIFVGDESAPTTITVSAWRSSTERPCTATSTATSMSAAAAAPAAAARARSSARAGVMERAVSEAYGAGSRTGASFIGREHQVRAPVRAIAAATARRRA